MWKYWSTKDLQHEIGGENLNFLSEVIPALDQSEAALNFIGSRSKLASLVESLQNHEYFRKKANLEKCLLRTPPEKIAELRVALDFSIELGDLGALAKKILSSQVSYEVFATVFDLDSRFLASDSVSVPPWFDNCDARLDSPKIITKPFKTLKSYQSDCLVRLNEIFDPPMSRAILQMPTGSGKTRTASEVMADHLKEPGIRQVVWLANTRELVEQAIQCMSEVWDHVGTRRCRFNRAWDGNLKRIPDWSEEDCVFTVMSLQSGWKLVDGDYDGFRELFSHTTLVVVDEAHIAVAPTYSEVIRSFVRTSQCKVLGLTATPGRTIEDETYELADLFFGNICSLEDPDESRDNAIGYLQSIGVMAEAFHQPLIYRSKIQLNSTEQASLEAGSDYSEKILAQLGSDADRTIAVVQMLRNLLDQDARIIMFAPSVENSFLVSAILVFLGYKSIHVSGKTPPKTRDSIIQKFVAGEHQIMCNYGVLATGFDAPTVDVVCIARPTNSPVLYSQMIGRGLRGPAVGGTEQCLVLEVIDNFVGQPNQDGLYAQFKDYWNEEEG